MTRIIVLEYHDVVGDGDFGSSGFDGPGADSYKMTASNFEAHLRAVAGGDTEAGMTVAAALTDVSAIEGRTSRTLFTFDDGGSSAHGEIAPRLQAHGWMGHFFVTTDRIGTPGFLDAPAMRELQAAGHVIGSHTCSHPIRMAACSSEVLRREWRDSVAILSDILGEAVTTASVPGGYHSDAVARAAAEAGITALFTSEPTTRLARVDGCTVLGRYTLRRDDPGTVAGALVAASHRARARQWSVWNAKKVLKALGGEVYLRARARVLGEG